MLPEWLPSLWDERDYAVTGGWSLRSTPGYRL